MLVRPFGDRGRNHAARVVSQVAGTRGRVVVLALHRPFVRAPVAMTHPVPLQLSFQRGSPLRLLSCRWLSRVLYLSQGASDRTTENHCRLQGRSLKENSGEVALEWSSFPGRLGTKR